MSKSIALESLLLGIAFVAWAGAESTALADDRRPQGASGLKKPASVPDEYVITPNGFFHPSCLVTISSDETWGSDLVIRGTDGAEHARVAPCAYPRYSLRGSPVSDESAAPQTLSVTPQAVVPQTLSVIPAFDGYLVDYIYTGPSWGTYLSDTWIVPDVPKQINPTGDVIFLWNAVQTSNALLQPVLDLGNNGDPKAWGIKSWNCCTNGIQGNTKETVVHPGDVIQGIVTASNCDATGICQSWTVTTADVTTGESQVLNTTSPMGKPYQIDPGVLETYNVTSCDMLPPAGEELFYDHTLKDANGQTVPLTYKLNLLTQPDPTVPKNCGYAGTVSGSTFTLIFSTDPSAGGAPGGGASSGGAPNGGGGASSGGASSGAAGRGGSPNGNGGAPSGGSANGHSGAPSGGGSANGNSGASGGGSANGNSGASSGGSPGGNTSTSSGGSGSSGRSNGVGGSGAGGAGVASGAGPENGASTDTGGSSGCSCTVAGAQKHGGVLGLGVALLLGWGARRRRARR